MLGNTIREQLVSQFLQINMLAGNAPNINWGSESIADSDALTKLVLSLSQAGLQIADASLESLSERIGLQLERKPPVAGFPGQFSVTSLSAAGSRAQPTAGHVAIDSISREGAAGLAQAFRGSLAPIRRIVMESRSAEECETRIREFYADWSPKRLATLCADALEAFSANGAVAAAAPDKKKEVNGNK